MLTRKRVKNCIFVCALLADRATKYWASSALTFRPADPPPPFFSIRLHRNYGISFSFLKNVPQASLFLNLAVLVGLFLACRRSKALFYPGIALLFAGGAGNFLDRLLYGYVVDWLYIGIYINMADIWLCTGAFLIFANVFSKPGGEWRT